jgi:hypothetical protein
MRIPRNPYCVCTEEVLTSWNGETEVIEIRALLLSVTKDKWIKPTQGSFEKLVTVGKTHPQPSRIVENEVVTNDLGMTAIFECIFRW